WATWSPVNYESRVIFPPAGITKTSNKELSNDHVTEAQLFNLKQKTYVSMVKDLVSRFQ
ncbi:hypothetical protein OFN64_31025, partial [Escherichia coli]|nr:hypothetical protein [Escherichia coli]